MITVSMSLSSVEVPATLLLWYVWLGCAVLRTAGRHHSSADPKAGQDNELQQEVGGQPEDQDTGSLEQRQHATHAVPPSRSTARRSRRVASRATSATAGLSPLS